MNSNQLWINQLWVVLDVFKSAPTMYQCFFFSLIQQGAPGGSAELHAFCVGTGYKICVWYFRDNKFVRRDYVTRTLGNPALMLERGTITLHAHPHFAPLVWEKNARLVILYSYFHFLVIVCDCKSQIQLLFVCIDGSVVAITGIYGYRST